MMVKAKKKIWRYLIVMQMMIIFLNLLPLNLLALTAQVNNGNKIVILANSENTFPGLVEAYQKLQTQGYNFKLKIFSGSDLTIPGTVEKLRKELQDANLLLMEMIGSSSYQTITNLLPNIPKSCKIISIRSDAFQNIDRVDNTQENVLKPYYDNGGPENMRRLLLYLLKNYCQVAVKEPVDPLPLEARFIYHPDAWGDVGQAVYEGVYENVDKEVYHGPSPQGTFTSFPDYFYWYREHGKYKEGAPWVGIMTFNSYFKGNDIKLYEALLRSLEAKGINVILTFTDSNKKQAVEDFFMEKGKSRIDFFIAAMGFNFIYGDSEASVKIFKQLNVPVMTPVFAQNMDDWQKNPAGISNELWWQIAYPELDGRIEPVFMGGRSVIDMDEATGAKLVQTIPLTAGIERVTGRVVSWINLRKKPNSEKKIAIIYYNHDGGKDGIGAAYLNVFSSLAAVLNALHSDGYTVKGTIDAKTIQELILQKGRNIGSWAPGELKELVKAGAITIPLKEYLKWYQNLPVELRAQVEKEWGPPPGKIMTLDNNLIIPGAILGNIFIGPQPIRGWGDDPDKIAHSPALPPTHQYIAFYFWLQKEFQADAVIHLGTHGTLEWLPGRSVGLGPDDWPDVLLGNIPDIYPYIVNNPGEATQAKRRGYAVTIGHLTPPMIKPQLYGDLAELQRLITDYREADNRKDNGRMAALQQQIIKLAKSNNLVQDLGLNLNNNDNFSEIAESLHAYLEKLTLELMPYGLHTLGQAPQGEMLDLMVEAIVDYDSASRQASAAEYRANLLQTSNEIRNLLKALRGEYIEPGLARDPVRVPDVMPTGRNLVSLDPRMIPDKAAWETGKKAADQLLAKYLAEKGHYPETVGIVLWAIETMRTSGETVAMIFRLIGVEPVWDKAGRVTSVKITPLEQLGRPRINVIVTISGLFRDTFAHTIGVLDDAFRLVALLKENSEDNLVRKHYLKLKEQLKTENLPEEDADNLALARIFGEAPGTYGTGVAEMVKSTSAWNEKQDLVNVYMNRMAFAYGRNIYGTHSVSAFTKLLTGVEVVTQVRDSLWGVLDNDDVYQYLGGLKLAGEATSGKGIETYITNTRKATGPQIETLAEFIGTELRTRLLNPKWIEGMLREGYSGSHKINDHVANLFGVDATMDGVSDWAWKKVVDTFVFDENIRNRLNPYALQSLIGWSMEAARRGMWQADKQTLSRLADVYIQYAVNYGVVCCHHTCANLIFNEWVASYSTLSQNVLKQFQDVLFKATEKPIKLANENKVKVEIIPKQVSSSWERDKVVETGRLIGAGEKTEVKAVNKGQPGQFPKAEIKAYELEVPQTQNHQSNSMPKGVTVFAIVIALGIVGIFIKGYLTKKI